LRINPILHCRAPQLLVFQGGNLLPRAGADLAVITRRKPADTIRAGRRDCRRYARNDGRGGSRDGRGDDWPLKVPATCVDIGNGTGVSRAGDFRRLSLRAPQPQKRICGQQNDKYGKKNFYSSALEFHDSIPCTLLVRTAVLMATVRPIITKRGLAFITKFR
jgi:hypothetical protein